MMLTAVSGRRCIVVFSCRQNERGRFQLGFGMLIKLMLRSIVKDKFHPPG